MIFFRVFKLIFISIFILSLSQVNATHYMGGEITWECLPNGQYVFTMKYYRECNGMQFAANQTITVVGHPSVTTIPVSRVSQTDISPVCTPLPAFNFLQVTCATVPGPNQGGVEEHVYVSNPVTLSGTPPPTGWMFHDGGANGETCCRNPSANLTNATSVRWALRAIMYPYTPPGATTPLPAHPCFDNSPVFAERPSTVICTGYPFTYNHTAFDAELDSLAYEWAPPLSNINQPVPNWQPGYSYTSPLPGTTHNPNNVPGTVNPYTGEISFTSFTQGAFQTVVKVTAYKCGVKVAEIFREMQIVLLACGNNNPPDVTAPFPDSTGLYTLYIDTVYAGELVTFPISATDFEFLPDGSPQTMTITAAGAQFGDNFTSTTTGCLNPPCAVLTPPPPVTGQFGVQSNFSWQTDCSHLANPTGCGTTSNVVNFLIKVEDDFCPAPAISISTVTIVVLPPPVLAPPDFRCVAVEPNGDVTLSWIPPVDDYNSFNSYYIHVADNPAGPFTVVDSIFDINQDTYTHTGANANNNSRYYYIETHSGCDGMAQFVSEPTDTLASIHLTAINNGMGNAELNWNPIIDPLLPSSDTWYYIYREYPAGNWILLDSTQNLTYLEDVTLCDASINYRVEIADASGCISVSSIDGDVFQDLTPPDVPVLDSVSVDYTNGSAIIGWTPSTAPDTDGYVVYVNDAGIWTAIDTVWGGTSNSYIDLNSNANNASEAYTIAAFDSCMNISAMVDEHNTIFVTSQIDICAGEITLNWNNYINMEPTVTSYNIWVNENGGPFNLLDNVGAGTTTYDHSGLNPATNYCYVIQATNGNITSSSNKICTFASATAQPEFVYLTTATVVDNSYVDVTFFADTAAFIKEFKVLRSENAGGPFTQIATLPPSVTSTVTYSDHSALITYTSYYYKVTVVDSCDVEAATSNIGRTIHLAAEGLSDMTNELHWNSYEEWLGNVDSYDIYRKDNDMFVPIANVPSGVNSYIDNVGDHGGAGGDFIYYVTAQEGPGNMYGFSELSTSNHAVAKQVAHLFVPSAFVPKGYNKIFKPHGVFIDATDYSFKIFGRWGEMVFHTNDPNEGWDGTFNGNEVPMGAYAYVIKFRDSENIYVQKRGTVTLIR